MRRSDLPDLLSFLIILMFSYAAISKLIDFNAFKLQMKVQPLPRWSVNALVYFLPGIEIMTAVSLLFKKTRTIGFLSSALLMLAFSIYVGLAMAGLFGSIPCSCGGIVKNFSWPQHFIFNLIFLFLSIYGIILDYQERRFIGK